MRRFRLFLLLVLVAALALISSVGTFLPHQMMMINMMGQGFGGMNFFWPIVLATSSTVATVGVVYVIAFPGIRYSPSEEEKEMPAGTTAMVDPLDIVMRVSKPDERAVLEVLKQSGGICYQKDIVYKTRLSKIKTHRIIARLAERGVIRVRKAGKTNEITVPSWLKTQSTGS